MSSVKKHLRLAALAFLLLVNIFIWSVLFNSHSSELLVYFFDVGQGDAILVKAPSGNKILIDSGPGRAVLSELSKVLTFNDRKIDVILATHPDADHIGGFPAVLERYDVDYVIEPGVSADTRIFESFERFVESEKSERVIARRGMRVDLGGGAILTILFPDRDVSEVDPNDASIIAKLFFGETVFLLTGDSPIKIEEYLVSLDGENLKSDVIKAGHHGSKTSSSESFIRAVSPEYAIISAGRDNRYGHPHQEVLDILNNSQAKILSTYESGTIIFGSDGRNLEIKLSDKSN